MNIKPRKELMEDFRKSLNLSESISYEEIMKALVETPATPQDGVRQSNILIAIEKGVGNLLYTSIKKLVGNEARSSQENEDLSKLITLIVDNANFQSAYDNVNSGTAMEQPVTPTEPTGPEAATDTSSDETSDEGETASQGNSSDVGISVSTSNEPE